MNNDLELFNRAMEFAKNKRPNGGLSNIYVAQTIDRDGNVTSETYGMNEFTKYGFEQYFVNGATWPRNMWIGAATTAESLINTNAIFEHITDDSDLSSLRDTNINYSYPMYFYRGSTDSDSIVTCVCKFQKSTFDYNLTGVGGDVSIGEYGIGNSQTTLWTHSWVYNTDGAKATITKYPNEKLEITIYFCLTYKLDIIKGNWANDIYTVITDLQRFLSGGNNAMNVMKAGILRRESAPAFERASSSSSYDSASDDKHYYFSTRSRLENYEQDNNTLFHPFIIYKNSGSYNGYFNGFYAQAGGFQILSPEQRGESEPFDIICRSTYDVGFHNTCLADRFGDDTNEMPFTQANITGCYLYNKFTGAYDNPVGYTNSATHQYSEASFETSMAVPIHYTNIDNILTMYVYQNLNITDPINAFNNLNIETIYATDEYWSTGNWEQIVNPLNIPVELRTKRYYITNTNSNKLVPVRNSGVFTLDPSGTYIAKLSFDEYGVIAQRSNCSNYSLGYFVIGERVFFPNESRVYLIDGISFSDSDSRDHRHFYYDSIVITFPRWNDNGGYFITNLDNPSDPHTIRKSVNDNGGYTNYTGTVINASYITESSTGLICLQRTTNVNESVVIDLSDRIVGSADDFAQYHYASIVACAIYSTENKKRVAYVPTSDTSIINVYDFDSESIIKTFNIPSGLSEPPIIIWGLNNCIWISGSSWTRVYQLDGDSNGIECSNNTAAITKADLAYMNITAVNDVILLYSEGNGSSFSYVYYTRTDSNINIIYNLGSFTFPSISSFRYLNMKLRYIEDNKTLALLVGVRYYNTWQSFGSYTVMIDLGRYVTPPPSSQSGIVDQFDDSRYESIGIYAYGENIITGKYNRSNWEYSMKQVPISNMLSHRLVGTTYTHTAVNSIIHVNEKTIITKYSNVAPPDYPDSGYPPGSSN